ncbi:MAG: hypothetical protein ACREEP_05580 [Dongiaceae bacterium]
MRRRPRSRTLFAWLAGAVCIVLAWLIYDQLGGLGTPESGESAQAGPSAAPSPLPNQAAFPTPDKAAMAVIVERPVFSQTRRPSRVAGGGAQGTSIDFALSGVVISGNERSALVRPVDGGSVQQLKEGEDIAGWTLVEIAPDRVVVRRDELEAEVFLDYAAPAPPLPRTESRKEKPAAEPGPQKPAEPALNPQGEPEAEPGGEAQE